MGSYNYRQIKAIESKNRDRLLCINPDLNDGSGIYFFLRQDEHGFRYAYIGQAKHILQRCCGHLTGYKQHIDLSIRKHNVTMRTYGKDDPDFFEVPAEEVSNG